MSETVSATLFYVTLPADGAAPYVYIGAPLDPNIPMKNYSDEAHEVTIENIRGKEDSVSLDTTGFQFYRQPSAHVDFKFNDKQAIETVYYKECIDLVKELTGASSAVVFDHSTLPFPWTFTLTNL